MLKIVGIATTFEEAKAAKASGAELIELRADLINNSNPQYAISLLKSIKKQLKLPVILTIRKKAEGGNFKGTETGRLDLFYKLLPLSDFIDIEISSVETLKSIINYINKNNKKLILSYHNFKKTPGNSELLNILNKAKFFKPFIIKIAAFIRNKSDFIRLLIFCKNHSISSNLAVIPMGYLSHLGRVICPIIGSCIAYGYVKNPVVSNQLSLKQLKTLLK